MDAAPEREIARVLREQADAWNRGDLDGFMDHYWKSDRVTFSAGGETLQGWHATLERYKRKYPTADRMGRVAFSNLRIRRLSETAALVLGEWRVQREPDPLSGNFSLIFQLINGRWVITHDHTSARPAGPQARGG